MLKGDIKTGRIQAAQSTKITWLGLANEFIKSAQFRGLAEQTIRTYEHNREYFFRFAGDIPCSEIDSNLMESYLEYLRDEKGLTNPVTINSYLGNLSPILKYGFRKRYIKENISVPTVKGQETFKEIYSQDELDRLLEKPLQNDFVTIRAWCIVWTLTCTGIRARELRNLKIKNVDMFNRQLIVNVTKNKKPRIIPISAQLFEVLKEYLLIRGGEPDDYLFASIYNEQLAMTTLQDSVKNYSTKRGVNKYSLHLFRHTFITNAVNTGVSPLMLQRITGHSTLMQLNRYYNARTEDLVQIIDSITPSLKQKKQILKHK